MFNDRIIKASLLVVLEIVHPALNSFICKMNHRLHKKYIMLIVNTDMPNCMLYVYGHGGKQPVHHI